jgi:DNA-binding transcriptional ArsR family regulator
MKKTQNDNRCKNPEHQAIAETAMAVLDTNFLKALSDPTRVLIIKKLIMLGASDVGTIAAGLSQDRSVISRHLATLERANIAVTRKIGRQVFYDLDNAYNANKVALILEAITPLVDLHAPFENLDENLSPKTGEAA